ncbi:MAG: hypothetical protein QF637_13245 [Acidimicrobiales bacterium]|jgi:hypothetical protein|nr:hypothetical protein [Acidimicrobiales bacterium]
MFKRLKNAWNASQERLADEQRGKCLEVMVAAMQETLHNDNPPVWGSDIGLVLATELRIYEQTHDGSRIELMQTMRQSDGWKNSSDEEREAFEIVFRCAHDFQ